MSLEDWPIYLGDYFGIDETSAAIILSIILILTIVLPVMYLAKDKHILAVISIMFISICLCVGLGWLDFWILIMISIITAMGIAYFGSEIIGGG